MNRRGMSVILFMSLLSGGLCNSVKRNYVSGYGFGRNLRYPTRSLVSNYSKFRKEKFVNRLMKVWPFVTIGLVGLVTIGGVVYFVSSDGSLTEVDNSGQIPTITQKKLLNKEYQPESSSWGNLVSRKVGNLTVRIYNGNITQIGKNEDVFKIGGLDDSESTAIVSPDNSNFSPGVLAGVISGAQNNKSGDSNQYLDKNSLSQKCNDKGWGGKIPTGCALLGDAGGYLGVKNIIHAVAPDHSSHSKKCKCKQELINVYKNSIIEAGNASLKRIVFPPMGDDSYGNSTESTASCFMQAIWGLYSEKKLGTIEYVDVVVHSKHNKPKTGKETKLGIFKERIEKFRCDITN